jgi:succinyl-CoA synthetase beta subunit
MGVSLTNEQLAEEHGINYIEIPGGGNIGCIVNGAGLAMSTMDMLKIKDGNPANFMDISGKVDVDAIDFGFQLLAHSKEIDVIFLNIFGGIVNCSKVAEGLLTALTRIENNRNRHQKN